MSDLFDAESYLLSIADFILDSHVGIVRELLPVPRHAGGPDFFIYHAQTCNTSAFVGQENFGSTAGSSTKRHRAMSKALGEAIERYSSAIYDLSEFTLCTYNEIAEDAVHPETFALFSENQYVTPGFQFSRFEADAPVRWCSAIDITSEVPLYIPAAMVYVPYYVTSDERLVSQPISTGLACHSTYERAVISGICEVVERDAFTLTWLQGISPPSIHPASLPPDSRDILDRFERTGRNVTVLNITRETGIPTILSVQQADSLEIPAIVVAAAASTSPANAVTKSLEELALTSHYMQTLHDSGMALNGETDPESVETQDHHLRFWCSHDHKRMAKFLFESNVTMPLDAIGGVNGSNDVELLEALATCITRTGHRVLVSDLTTDDVADLHLHVTKVVIPGFHPLFIGHKYRALGGKRLSRPPSWADSTPGIINEAPHPYP